MEPTDDADVPTLALEIAVSRLPADGLDIRFEASEAEREALADFLALLAVETLKAELHAERLVGDIVRVRGRLVARVVHASVVTLDPVVQTIDEPVEFHFVEATSRSSRRRDEPESELVLSLDDDPPDVFANGRIALGDSLREALALVLDPYPRETGRPFEPVDTDPDPDAGKVSPFAALSKLTKPGDG